MTRLPLLVAAVSVLAACGGPEALVLPADTVDRAATCGVVAAATARTSTDIQSSLPFEAQGRILHYALLAASEGKSFSPETATAVSKRMSELQADVTGGKWKDLKPECDAAYPEVAKTEVELPAGRFDSQLGCDAMADFMMTALRGQENDYGNELAEYRQLRSTLNQSLGAGMASRAGTDIEAQQVERRRTMGALVKLGPPTAVLRACIKRYG